MRIGVFGGSFDPVHNGHLQVAETCGRAASLDQVLLVPAAAQPLKPQGPVASAEDRIQMLHLALEGRDGMQICTLEIERGGVSYTADTLRELAELHPSDSLYLILGADAVNDLPHWREPDVICRLATLLVVDRAGAPPVDAAQLGAGASTTPSIISASMDPVDVSSTDIRRRSARDEPIEHLVPQSVSAYIRQKRLYK